MGGADASQKGLGEEIPAILQLRSAMIQILINTQGGDFAILYRRDGQVLTRCAVTACPNIRQAGVLKFIHLDTAMNNFRFFITFKRCSVQCLADCLE